MSQNLVTLKVTAAEWSEIDQHLGEIEARLSGLIALSVGERRKLARMGDKSEAFCRQTLSVLGSNPQVVPPSLDLAAAQGDLEALDQLRPRLQRLQRLGERAADTDIALGSDIMRCALDGYQLLKVAGRNQGLEGLRKELGSRFSKAGRQPDAEAATVA